MISFDPLLDPNWIIGLALLCGVIGLIGAWNNHAGSVWRLLAALIFVLALFNPHHTKSTTEPLDDIVVLMVDRSASQSLGGRNAQIESVIESMRGSVKRLDNTQLLEVEFKDRPASQQDAGGTHLLTTLHTALTQVPETRLSAVIILTDGNIHDEPLDLNLAVPVHTILTGKPSDHDRRITLKEVPPFSILGQDTTIKLRIDDDTATNAPINSENLAKLLITVGSDTPLEFSVPMGQDLELPIQITQAGKNVFSFETPRQEGELTPINNRVSTSINGIRDRLRVLLVSGAPHPGGRMWRNLLKSDPSVDLVHFTILRSLDKEKFAPDSELSLIPFPMQELFEDKLNEFDLIIFDRFTRRGILNTLYLENIRDYVKEGGAVFVSAGPAFASAQSLYRSPLSEILPGVPTAQVKTQAFSPKVTLLGQRHPISSSLPQDGEWGRWLRLVEVEPTPQAITLMSGTKDLPLLLTQRVQDGRVALLTSDQTWLWARGFEGGGPHVDLLKRVSHWLMKEPELEEETLYGERAPGGFSIIRKTLSQEQNRPVKVISPDGRSNQYTFKKKEPGVFVAQITAQDAGIYHIHHGDLNATFALGALNTKEFSRVLAAPSIVAPVSDAHHSGLHLVSNGAIDLQKIQPGQTRFGASWLGLYNRSAYNTLNISRTALLPPWLALLLSACCVIGAWAARRKFTL